MYATVVMRKYIHPKDMRVEECLKLHNNKALPSSYYVVASAVTRRQKNMLDMLIAGGMATLIEENKYKVKREDAIRTKLNIGGPYYA